MDQLSSVHHMRNRKMFGEYAVYCQDKVVALVCDNELFVKITEAGKKFMGKSYVEGPPFPGAKPWMRVDGDKLEDREFLSELIEITTKALPVAKKKK